MHTAATPELVSSLADRATFEPCRFQAVRAADTAHSYETQQDLSGGPDFELSGFWSQWGWQEGLWVPSAPVNMRPGTLNDVFRSWAVSLSLHAALLASLWLYAGGLARASARPPILLGVTTPAVAQFSGSPCEIDGSEARSSDVPAVSLPTVQVTAPAVEPTAVATLPESKETLEFPVDDATRRRPDDATRHRPDGATRCRPDESVLTAADSASSLSRQSASFAPQAAMSAAAVVEQVAGRWVAHLPSRSALSEFVQTVDARGPGVAPPQRSVLRPPGVNASVEAETSAVSMMSDEPLESPADKPRASVSQVGSSGSVGGTDTQLEAVFNAPPRYPLEAVRNRWQGTVVLRLWVSTRGLVEEVAVVTSSGHSMLDDVALEAARQWRFRPAQDDGRTAAASVLLPVVFDLSR